MVDKVGMGPLDQGPDMVEGSLGSSGTCKVHYLAEGDVTHFGKLRQEDPFRLGLCEQPSQHSKT